jgi:hypothetical protein
MMAYITWYQTHAKKHKDIVDKLLQKEYTKGQIIDYFEYNNLISYEPDFCRLFSKGKKCHNIEPLNCYLCACPNFRFDDSATTIKSYCSIECVKGKQVGKDIKHHDCSDCLLPHEIKYISKHFDTNWSKIMEKCNENSDSIDK